MNVEERDVVFDMRHNSGRGIDNKAISSWSVAK
jgi:hypothetical protein